MPSTAVHRPVVVIAKRSAFKCAAFCCTFGCKIQQACMEKTMTSRRKRGLAKSRSDLIIIVIETILLTTTTTIIITIGITRNRRGTSTALFMKANETGCNAVWPLQVEFQINARRTEKSNKAFSQPVVFALSSRSGRPTDDGTLPVSPVGTSCGCSVHSRYVVEQRSRRKT